MKSYHRALTIAGSDSGGGAGVQADLKTFSALGCYGLSVITALTAQNTVTVRSIHSLPLSFIAAQLEAVLEDIGAEAVKIGMLHTPEIILTVARGLARYGVSRIVLDPVMISKSGHRLLQEGAVEQLKELLIPRALIITPNLPEAAALLGRPVETRGQMEGAARELLAWGPRAVIVKGGHLEGRDKADCLVYRSQSGGVEISWLEGTRIDTRNTHGSGCTFSSAICAFLARGSSLPEAAVEAKDYLSKAMEAGAAYRLGAGQGPVHHFHALWRDVEGG